MACTCLDFRAAIWPAGSLAAMTCTSVPGLRPFWFRTFVSMKLSALSKLLMATVLPLSSATDLMLGSAIKRKSAVLKKPASLAVQAGAWLLLGCTYATRTRSLGLALGAGVWLAIPTQALRISAQS